MNKRRFGIIGEKIAQNYLKNKGYKIIETNFYTRKGEIDIIAQKDKCIIFAEIKTRNNFEYGTPAMAVNAIKKTNKLYGWNVRFDVIEVIIKSGKCQINHIENIM